MYMGVPCSTYVCDLLSHHVCTHTCGQGYSLSGHCIVLLMSTLFDHYGTPGVFYVMWVGLGGLSATKLVSLLIHV